MTVCIKNREKAGNDFINQSINHLFTHVSSSELKVRSKCVGISADKKTKITK